MVVNAYCSMVVKDHNDVAVNGQLFYYMDSMTMSSIAVGGTGIGKCLKVSTFQKIVHKFRYIVGPLNENLHWNLVVIDLYNNNVIYLDPQQADIKHNVRINNIRSFLRDAYTKCSIRQPSIKFRCSTLPHQLQTDSHWCGVLICKYLKSYLRCGQVELAGESRNIENLRKDIGNYLLKACGYTFVSNDSLDWCRVCGGEEPVAVTSNSPIDWVDCDSCGSWFHERCIGRDVSSSSFTCKWCSGSDGWRKPLEDPMVREAPSKKTRKAEDQEPFFLDLLSSRRCKKYFGCGGSFEKSKHKFVVRHYESYTFWNSRSQNFKLTDGNKFYHALLTCLRKRNISYKYENLVISHAVYINITKDDEKYLRKGNIFV